jgi:hypothetical protein
MRSFKAAAWSFLVTFAEAAPAIAYVAAPSVICNLHGQALAVVTLPATPEEVRQPREDAGHCRPAPRLRATTHAEMGDERRGEVDREPA